MRVALFVDGKNFYAGWRETTGGGRMDFGALSRWLVEQAGGTSLWAAHYYTSEEQGAGADNPGQRALACFLDMLEHQPGFFVYRFPQRPCTTTCPACGHEAHGTQEKEVDTTMVADMLTLAAVSAFDVLVSGDADLTPAVEGVRRLGKQAYVATWGGHGLANRLRRAVFDHIDLLEGAEHFLHELAPEEHPGAQEPASPPRAPAEGDDLGPRSLFIEELRRAEAHFGDGYVGLNYFVTRWQSPCLSDSDVVRRDVLDQLQACGRVEVYATASGDLALRCVHEE